jgi:hypothetical protein
LVEIPYQFDDREAGESKMSTREAAGYLFQLKDLYVLRFSKFGRPSGTTRNSRPPRSKVWPEDTDGFRMGERAAP